MFQCAVQVEPLYAPRRPNLGQALLILDERERRSSRALPRKPFGSTRASPRSTITWATSCRRSTVSMRLGRPTWEALSLNPGLPLANAHVGLLLQKKRPLSPKPFPWLRKAVALEPATAEFWEWLADLHGEMDEPAARDSLLGAGTGAGPGVGSAVRLSLGRALQDEGRLAEAREQYWNADLSMPHSGAPQLNLGWLHELLGEMDQAESAFRQALIRQPNFPALTEGWRPCTGGQVTARKSSLARSPPGRRATRRKPRARLLFGLAHVLDAR